VSGRAGIRVATAIAAAATIASLGAAVARAQPPSGVVHPDPAGKTRLELGAELYAANCAACHGEGGRGVPLPHPDSAGGITGQGPPLIGVGEQAPDFYLRSGRMPLSRPGEQPNRRRPFFDEREIRALVAYVASFGEKEGPAIPAPDPAEEHLTEGRSLFTDHCAGCHQIVAQGGYATGARVPPLQGIPAREIAEAVRLGPYLMPEFPKSQIDDEELDKIIAYVLSTEHPEDAGGLGIGHVGPIPEGMVAWLLAGAVLVGACMLLGERLRRK
jgi:ubiquinol-cytochrome c reductase cytochrome c subunit